jgi:hypothetical protein
MLVALTDRDWRSPMDQAFYDLNDMNPLRGRSIEFTRSDNPHWSGIVELPPGKAFETTLRGRTDVYVLHGEVMRDDGEVSAMGDFVSYYDKATLEAAFAGAILLVYREPAADRATTANFPAADRSWAAARVPGMHISPLTMADYMLAFFHWAQDCTYRLTSIRAARSFSF